jgi:Leucine-rich repeat (LRR) protein
LVELDLSLNFLTSVPVEALGQLRNLKFLNLGSNRIQVWRPRLWIISVSSSSNFDDKSFTRAAAF